MNNHNKSQFEPYYPMMDSSYSQVAQLPLPIPGQVKYSSYLIIQFQKFSSFLTIFFLSKGSC